MIEHMRCNTPTSRRVWHGRTVLLSLALFGVLGAAGCEEEERPAQPSTPVAVDAGPCPAPNPNAGSCEGGPRWARSPSTGTCCEYSSDCAVPYEWPRFTSPSACQTDCRCERVTAADGSEVSDTAPPDIEWLSLECGCGSFTCPARLADALSEVCTGQNVNPPYLARGCGKVAVQRFGFVGSELVFDEATGALLGFLTYDDVPHAPCQTYNTVAGEQFDCPSATVCELCASEASASSTVPACE